MQPLRAPERPVSHYRHGKLRTGSEPHFVAMTTESAAVDPGADREPRSEARRGIRPEPRLTAKAEAHDPAPSRLAYRMERLWLTPLFRRVMRFGLPVLTAALLIGVFVGDTDRRAAISAQFAAVRSQFENRPEFMVKLMSIDGASGPVADAIRAMMPVELPASSFAIDLEAMRAGIEQVDAVAEVKLRVRAGGILAVQVSERRPAVLWRTGTSLEMLDATGHRVATLLDRSARPDLPVIAGEGAEQAVPEALAILAAAKPILLRVRGLLRIGARRWDMVLDRDQRILLPEGNPIQAVEQAIAIDAAEELLARDLAMVDLRNAERPTLRLTPGAVEETRKLTETVTRVAGQ